MVETREFDTVFHKYYAFWKAKKNLYQALDATLLVLTGGFWMGWLVAELLLVAIDKETNEGIEQTHEETTTQAELPPA